MRLDYTKSNLEFDDSLDNSMKKPEYSSSLVVEGKYDSTASAVENTPMVYKIVDIQIPNGVDLIACAFGMCGDGQPSCPRND
jgi:hypothetical protein